MEKLKVIKIREELHKRLKVLSAQYGKTLGETIEILLDKLEEKHADS